MHLLGINANIMSLGGIAIAIGAMVDAAIVMIENAHKHLERAPPGKPRIEVLIDAASEVGPALFFPLLIITVSFLPVFTLEAQEGRLFKPLAYTKTFAMAAAALLSVTLVPALMMLFMRGRILPGAPQPAEPLPDLALSPGDRAGAARASAHHPARRSSMLAATAWPAHAARLRVHADARTKARCSTCRPRLPGMSVTKAAELLQTQDKIIKTFPEVAIGVRQGRPRRDRDRSGADSRCSRPSSTSSRRSNGGPA